MGDDRCDSFNMVTVADNPFYRVNCTHLKGEHLHEGRTPDGAAVTWTNYDLIERARLLNRLRFA